MHNYVEVLEVCSPDFTPKHEQCYLLPLEIEVVGIMDRPDESEDESVFQKTIMDPDQVRGGATNRPKLLYCLTGLSAIGGFLFGYDTGVVSGAMILVRKLNNFWHEIIVSGTVASALLFSLLGAQIADVYGRKAVIYCASVAFTIGTFFMALASGPVMLLVGRLIVGVGIGFASMSVPMYISESCPANQRGKLVTLNQVFITGGQFVASVMCGIFANSAEGWRYMLGLGAIPAVLQFFCFIPMPESPRYLVERGRLEEASAVLASLRSEYDNVQEELEEIKIAASREGPKRTSISEVMAVPSIRKALILGCLLQFFAQFCGINTVMYYSASIIQMAGFHDESEAIWLASLTAFVNFVCSFIGIYYVDTKGRRPLLLGSLAGVTLSLFLLSGSFAIMKQNTPPSQNHALESELACDRAGSCFQCLDSACGFCLDIQSNQGICIASNSSSCQSNSSQWLLENCPSTFGALAVLAMCLYLLFFEVGLGPLPWAINTEIYPTWARSTCGGLATAVNWSSNLMVSMTFLSLISLLGQSTTFLVYAFIALSGLVTFYLILPETKGQTLEETAALFDTSKRLGPRYSRLESTTFSGPA
eukprot:maker-scaffold33_size549341-snap-gene-1.28 protein:Tk11528 transcript:maker-scaffold33_size549341-snap-gene-1.28-mRNA-1 annotation:"hypothetical protein DAPPUDRAFT_304502"